MEKTKKFGQSFNYLHQFIFTPMKNKTEIQTIVKARRNRSAWDRAVALYALELLESLEGDVITEKELLNGARTWKEFSDGGCSLIYDADICERLCPPGEAKRRKGGRLPPNGRETWLDCQARALCQAARWVLRLARME
jgi:hypothetical protein